MEFRSTPKEAKKKVVDFDDNPHSPMVNASSCPTQKSVRFYEATQKMRLLGSLSMIDGYKGWYGRCGSD